MSSHKHLGVIFSEDLSWTTCIISIIANAQKKLGLMKKLKFKLNRKSLSLLYTSFIRPQSGYASDVWGGWSFTDSEKLHIEQIQLIAARIVTGLPIFASRESLYIETGCETLVCRRKMSRLKTMFKIDRNLLPNYVIDIFPNKRVNTPNNILQEMHKTIVYQNAVYNCITLHLFPLLSTNGMRISVKATPFAVLKKNYMLLS